jgi:hypothetical protein
VGNAWNVATNTFTAPHSGNYFMSFAFAVEGATNGELFMYVNGAVAAQALLYDNGAYMHNNLMTARSGYLLRLSASDTVTFNYKRDIASTPDGLTNAQGFYYSPLGGAAAAVAWAVCQSQRRLLAVQLDYEVVFMERGVFNGPVAVMPYNTINVNLQNVWNPSTNKVTVAVAGTYYIDLTMYPCGSAWGGDGNPGSIK